MLAALVVAVVVAEAAEVLCSMFVTAGTKYFNMPACPWHEDCSKEAWKRAKVWGWSMEELRSSLQKHLKNSSMHHNRSEPEIDALVESLDENSFEIDTLECTQKEADQWNSWMQWDEEQWRSKQSQEPTSSSLEKEEVAQKVPKKDAPKRRLRESLSASSEATLHMGGHGSNQERSNSSDDPMDEDEEPRRKQPRTPLDKPKAKAKSQIAFLPNIHDK